MTAPTWSKFSNSVIAPLTLRRDRLLKGIRRLPNFEKKLGEVVSELKSLKAEVSALRTAPPLKACPLCVSEFPEFGRFRRRAHARCPGCGCMERHRLAWLFLRDQTPLLSKPTRFLHFAPEPALRARIETNLNVTYTGTSYDPEKPDEGVDMQRLPFADGSFDMLYCSHVLEHVPDDRLGMRELYRVLSAGGLAIIMVPARNMPVTHEDPNITTPEDRTKHYGQYDHLRYYGRDVVDRLREAGFEVQVEYPANRLSVDEQIRYCVANEPIFVCRKA